MNAPANAIDNHLENASECNKSHPIQPTRLPLQLTLPAVVPIDGAIYEGYFRCYISHE